MSIQTRLNRAFENVPVLPLSADSRYILVSDCHRGTGTSSDNFLKNQNLYFAAMQHYYDHSFTCIELGDGDELWENRSLAQIKQIHNNAFWLLSKFYEQNRLYMIYGNHDMVKKQPSFAASYYSTYPCSTCHEEELFPGIIFYSGIILRDCRDKKDIYLTHGHQADFFNSILWKFSRFLVRYLWRPLENIGFLDPTSAAKNNSKKKRIEYELSSWAEQKDCILITGHTHRPMLDSAGSPYFNTGSCVHPRCITCIEIIHRCLTLVKWSLSTRSDKSLYVSREVLAGPICVDSFSRKTDTSFFY